ncbi:MAG: metalloprotease family protein [Candidatus Promineifilaceae bacterium]
MKPVKDLGPEYVLAGKLEVESRQVAIGLNLVGLAMLFVFGWIFLLVVATVRPEVENASLAGAFDGLTLLPLLLTLVLVLVLHELVHGFFFWHFTGERPRFGFHLVYAYAAAPDWYLPRSSFMVTGSAPFLLISILGLLLLTVVPFSAVPLVFLGLTANAAGSVGDFLVVGWLLTNPTSTMARDTGLKITIYTLALNEVTLMQQRWFSLLDSLRIPLDAAREAFHELNNYYSRSDRYYHNLEHVGDVLDVIEELKELARDLGTVQLSAWYHDVIYDAHAKDNEVQSAAYAERRLSALGLPPAAAKRVSDMILATKTHIAPDGDVDCQILLDADLSSLGADQVTFERHSQALRKEFDWLPDQEYQLSRARFLSGILERNRIYLIDQVFEKYEEQARENLTRAIDELS